MELNYNQSERVFSLNQAYSTVQDKKWITNENNLFHCCHK